MAQLLAVLCSVCGKLGAQVVWSSKVVGLEHPSLEIIEAIFATSDKGCRPQGQARCLTAYLVHSHLQIRRCRTDTFLELGGKMRQTVLSDNLTHVLHDMK